jgi:hypothetical protein
MAGLWLSREHALAVLSEQTPDVLAALDDAFCLMDDCASALWAVNTPFARVTALYAAKSRNLALGCYSLTLDSLAQEGGALLRPLLECHELLTYFRLDPSRVHEALENRLPSAGSVAKRIGSNYQVARDYLNQHASHVSMQPACMQHLVELADEGSWSAVRTHQPFRPRVALFNLHLLFAVFGLASIEAANCAAVAECPEAQDLSDRVFEVKERGLAVFEVALSAAQA